MAHVMFSYNWDHQGLVLEVVRILKSQGVDVWVDVQGSTILEKIHGSTDEMMIKVCSSNTASCSAVGKCAQSLTTSVIAGREQIKPRGRVCEQEIPHFCQLQSRGAVRHLHLSTLFFSAFVALGFDFQLSAVMCLCCCDVLEHSNIKIDTFAAQHVFAA